ncbi:MAG: ABC transporter ATP-binding protein [Myxococcales bacterium]|nr:ABC transporter ATP-binding protein [Myxococcales bacterium]
MSPNVIALRGLCRTYLGDRPELAVHAVRKVSFTVERGESIAIVGTSGCGKSTLLQVLGCLDRATDGVYELDGQDVSGLDDDALAEVRNRKVGFVFQSFHLLPRLDAIENVELPLLYSSEGASAKAHRERAMRSLARVGLADRAHHLPAELSGGQRQRVAIARALVTHPSMLLCDEPTGALDSRTGADVLQLLADLHAEGTTLVMVTHDLTVARAMRRALWMHDGEIVADDTSERVVTAFARAQQEHGA